MGNAKRRAFGALLLTASAVGAVGCEAEVAVPPAYAYGYPYAYPPVGAAPVVVSAGVVPFNIYAYPRVLYNGGYVYLVDHRWYYPSARGVMVYQREPAVLARYRGYYYAHPGYRAYPPAYYRGYRYPYYHR